jgi:transposase
VSVFQVHGADAAGKVVIAIRDLGEFGIVAPVGGNGVEELLEVVADPSDKRVPEIVRACLAALGQLHRLQ